MQLRYARRLEILALLWATAGPAAAECLAPQAPQLPRTRPDILRYEALLREDFSRYMAEIQVYFRCMDAERAQAFVEAQAVTQDYGRFLELLDHP